MEGQVDRLESCSIPVRRLRILIDCKRFEDGPVCRIALPHKISSGTHACWADRRFLTAEADVADAA